MVHTEPSWVDTPRSAHKCHPPRGPTQHSPQVAPRGAAGRCLKPSWCWEGRLGEADTLPAGTPSHPSTNAPRSRCEASSLGWGPGASCWWGGPGGPDTLAGWHSPRHTPVGGESRDILPPFSPPLLSLRALGMKLPLLGVRVSSGLCALPLAVPRVLTGLLFPAGDGVSSHHQEPHRRRSSQATMPLSLPMAPQVRAVPPRIKLLTLHLGACLTQAGAGIKDVAD